MAGRLPTGVARACAHVACIAGSFWVCVAFAACARGPIELGFWIEAVSYASTRLGDPISSGGLATIESIRASRDSHSYEENSPSRTP